MWQGKHGSSRKPVDKIKKCLNSVEISLANNNNLCYNHNVVYRCEVILTVRARLLDDHKTI